MPCVYVLQSSKDPTVIRYVGISHYETPDHRLAKHLTSARAGSNYAVHQWIRKHISQGHTVTCATVIAGISWEEAYACEKELILELKVSGHNLLNRTDGGLGALGRKVSEETRKKMSDAAKKRPGRKQSKEEKEKRREFMLGFKHSEETKKKLSQMAKGKPGRKHTAETIEKIKAKQTGVKRKPLTQEHKDKLAEASSKHTHSEETRLKMSKSQKGRTFSDMTRRKMSEAAKNRRKT